MQEQPKNSFKGQDRKIRKFLGQKPLLGYKMERFKQFREVTDQLSIKYEIPAKTTFGFTSTEI